MSVEIINVAYNKCQTSYKIFIDFKCLKSLRKKSLIIFGVKGPIVPTVQLKSHLRKKLANCSK